MGDGGFKIYNGCRGLNYKAKGLLAKVDGVGGKVVGVSLFELFSLSPTRGKKRHPTQKQQQKTRREITPV